MKRKTYEKLTILLFCIALFSGFVLSQIMPLRPSYSEEEKRELAKFPKLSVSALASGSYFSDISTWFSDTFPFREALVSINSRITALHGASPIVITGDVTEGDDIPDGEESGGASDEKEPDSGEKTPVEPYRPSGTFSDDKGVDENYVDPDDPGAQKKFGAVLQVGDTAYEYYGFSESAANMYGNVVNKAADLLAGQAQVYVMVIPNSMGIMLPDSLRGSVKTADQEKAIDYIYAQMHDSIIPVPIFATLMSHRSEYIYYRTDHHWSALGAYYAYTRLAWQHGWEVNELSKFDEADYGDFLGSFYTSTNKSSALEKHPDTLYAYKPFYEYDFTYQNRKGKTLSGPLVRDVSTWAKSGKYNSFISGDNPYSVVENHDISDDSACVILKESYGNAFVPFLAAHYRHTYVIDYRYWEGSLRDFVLENNVQDVYFVNNIMAAQSKTRIGDMELIVQ